MKSKKLNKKLLLNKATIASLTKGDLLSLKGGAEVTTMSGLTCVYCDTNFSCDDVVKKCFWEVSCPEGCMP